MREAYAYSPQIWPPLLTSLLVAGLGFYAWRHREVPGAVAFAIACIFAALWSLASTLEAVALAGETRILWAKITAALQMPAVSAIAVFILEYVWPGRWLTRRNLILLSVMPLLLILMVATEPLHGLLWRGFLLADVVIPLRKPLMWGFIAYGYLLALLELSLLGWLFARSPAHRAPVALIMAGQVASRILYLADPRLDVYTITIAMLTYAVALFGFRILDVHTLAREAAIGGMQDAMLVLDRMQRVASLNPAAERVLAMPAPERHLRTLRKLTPGHAALATLIASLDAGQDEVTLPGQDGPRDYLITRNSLTDFRGLHTGDLFLLRDITDQRAAQQRLLDQERALASLREREQLAREMHDSIGQVLGYAGLQTDIVATLVEQGQSAEATLALERLRGVLRDAHADVRQQILALRAVPSPQEPFCDQVRRYVQGFAANYAIASDLELCDGTGALSLAPDAQAQLYRILQEALANVRKHSGARRVHVRLEPVDRGLCMTIADDGHGFDVRAAGGPSQGHLGLVTMRERAEEIGGTLDIDSGPGGSTVRATVPVRRDAGACAARR
ncbi:MAG: histidine kinase N-terminal 7TM domain-containing protein [Anaerolineae bacterium]